MNESGEPIYRIGEIEIDTSGNCLRCGNEELHLRPKTFQVLLYLIEHRSRLVTKEELMENLWPETAVTDDALVQCIVDIRKALGDDSRHPKFVKTLPKIGYRFISPVEELLPEGLSAIETEEFTSLEIEIEEEITNGGLREWENGGMGEWESGREDRELRVQDHSERTPPSILYSLSSIFGPRRSLTPRRFTLALAIVVGVVPISIYLGQRLWPSRLPQAEVTLPHVPGKKPVVVIFFENQSGNQDLDWLREGLADMLITGLSRSNKLAVLSRQQLSVLLERIGHEPAPAIRLDEALDLARRSRAEVIVSGSFARLGEKIRLDAQLHDAQTGRLLAAESLIADRPDQILTQVDLLSLKLASHLGSRTAPDRGPGLAELMTDNLEAYRYYSLAVEKAQAYHNADALTLLEAAAALDPEFAMAHARIGYIYAVTWGLADQAKPYLERAFRLSHRLTEKDKLYIEAWYAIANLDYASAIPPLQQLLDRYPLEVEAYQRLGHLLRGEERFEEAIDVLQQGLVIDPDAQDTYNALGGLYSNLNRHEEAIAMMKRYVALAPGEPNAYDSLALSYQWAGRADEALAAYQQALALRPDFEISIVNLGNLYYLEGRYRDATRQYERYLRLARSDMEREKGYGSLAWVYWKKGDLARAAAAAEQELKYGQSTSVGNALMIALKRNDLTRAGRLKDRLFAQSPYTHRGARAPLRYLYFFLGSFALKAGDSTEAIAHFKEALKHLPPLGGLESVEDCLANAYLELGRWDEAIAEYERILQFNPRYPLAQYHLGQAYERKGQRERARAAYEQFLQVWKDADPDIPQVIETQQRLTGLR